MDEMEMAQEINMLCTLRPKPSTSSRLKEVLLTLSQEVKAHEPGCLSYQLWEYTTDKAELAFVLIEKWTCENALENHHRQTYLIEADRIIEEEELLAEKEVDRFLAPVGGFVQS